MEGAQKIPKSLRSCNNIRQCDAMMPLRVSKKKAGPERAGRTCSPYGRLRSVSSHMLPENWLVMGGESTLLHSTQSSPLACNVCPEGTVR